MPWKRMGNINKMRAMCFRVRGGVRGLLQRQMLHGYAKLCVKSST